MTAAPPTRSATFLLTLLVGAAMACGPGDPPGSDGQRSSSPPGRIGALQPVCSDAQYSEEPPTRDDISFYIDRYDANDARAFYEGVLGVRYPMGAQLVAESSTVRIDCVETFKGQAKSVHQALQQITTVVHECGHFHDLEQSNATLNHYTVTPSLAFNCRAGDSMQRGGRTMARSRLLDDDFASRRPACDGNNCDIYALVYFRGDPDDDDISESGDQGYNMLLEEMLQYINSLATSYAFSDVYNAPQIERDAVLTFLWYIERYLYLARTQYPEVYTFLTRDACWRQLTLTLWGRAWFYLERSRDTPSLGVHDEVIEALATDPSLLNEINALRKLDGCQAL